MEYYLDLNMGLDDNARKNALSLSEGSYNFYNDEEGMLVNYPGKIDFFYRGTATSYRGTPPVMNTIISRIMYFRDSLNVEHVVFVRGNQVCVTYGNSYKVLYTLYGRNYAGIYNPTMFVHESKLIIVNFGDPVLIWDGIDKVNPLGVCETPQPPELRSHVAPGTTDFYDYGVWAYRNCWWPGDTPSSGPSEIVDSYSPTPKKIWGYYSVIVQFVDKYGNKGRVSPPSKIEAVKPTTTVVAVSPVTHDYDSPVFLISNWLPPMVEDHIQFIIIGRTTNVSNEDPEGGLESLNIYYQEYIFSNTTEGRFVHILSDAALLDCGKIDMESGPPPQAAYGISWNGRVLLWGLDDGHVLAYSDKGLFGQYRLQNRYYAKGTIKEVISLGDRIVVITEYTIEVLYEDTNSGYLGVLEQNDNDGTLYSRTFVAYLNYCFGLFNSGFGFYDGKSLTYIETPYFIKDTYIDPDNIGSARLYRNWYIATVRSTDASTGSNNKLLIYDFVRKQWYIINESVFDVCVYNDILLGVNYSIYQLFRGSYPSSSKIVIDGIVPQGSSLTSKRTLTDVSLLMEASSKELIDISISAEFTESESVDRITAAQPSQGSINRKDFRLPVWNDINLLYTNNVKWQGPGLYWIKPSTSKAVPGFYHRLEITFASQHQVKIKGVCLNYSDYEDKGV